MSYLDTYKLPKTSKKIICPQCGHKTFKPYVSAETGEPVNEAAFGRCDRQNECGYNVPPKIGQTKNTLVTNIVYPAEDILKNLNRMRTPLHEKIINNGVPAEFIYSSGVFEQNGLTVFVFRNEAGKLCNLKYFKYKQDGHRTDIDLPNGEKIPSYSLKQPEQRNEYIMERYTMPLFGEHELDKDKKRIVCVVESEKSKVIAKFHYPEFDWVACGSANGLSDGTDDTADKIKPLKGRTVYWVSDADKAARGKMMVMEKTGKEEWVWCSSIRNGIKYIEDFHIVDLWPTRDDGYDIGDALLEGLKPEIKPTWSKKQADPRYKSYVPPDWDRMTKEYEGGLEIGTTSGINKDFDNVLSWMRTHVNAYYGWPKDGKSTFVDFVSLAKAKASGWKTCMFKPEDMSAYFDGKNSKVTADRIYAKLCWSLTGQTPFEHYAKRFGVPLLPKDKYQEAKEWIMKHFFVVYPSDRKYRNIFDEFLYFYEMFGVDHFEIDPWNTVMLDNVERGDERLVQAFVHSKEFVLKTNTVLSIINHPGSRHDVKEKNGAFKVVNQFMQLGGSAWDIKMDGQFSIQRPLRHKDANSQLVTFWNLNQRDSEIVGAQRGSYEKIEFDNHRRQYYFDGVCPIDGSLKTPQQTKIEYTPTWHKKKKDKPFDQHVAQDWAQPKEKDDNPDDPPF